MRGLVPHMGTHDLIPGMNHVGRPWTTLSSRGIRFEIFDPPEARYQTGAPSFSPGMVFVGIFEPSEARYQTGGPCFSPVVCFLRYLTRRRQYTKPQHQETSSFHLCFSLLEISDPPEARYQTGAASFSTECLLLKWVSRRRPDAKLEHQAFLQECF